MVENILHQQRGSYVITFRLLISCMYIFISHTFQTCLNMLALVSMDNIVREWNRRSSKLCVGSSFTHRLT